MEIVGGGSPPPAATLAHLSYYKFCNAQAGKDQQGKGYDPRKLLKPGADAIMDKVKEKIELFGSANKA